MKSSTKRDWVVSRILVAIQSMAGQLKALVLKLDNIAKMLDKIANTRIIFLVKIFILIFYGASLR